MAWRQFKQPDTFNQEDLTTLLRDRQRELDTLGDWAGCREWLNQHNILLFETRQATRAVDTAFQDQDTDKAKQAIETYCQTWRRIFENYHSTKEQ